MLLGAHLISLASSDVEHFQEEEIPDTCHLGTKVDRRLSYSSLCCSPPDDTIYQCVYSRYKNEANCISVKRPTKQDQNEKLNGFVVRRISKVNHSLQPTPSSERQSVFITLQTRKGNEEIDRDVNAEAFNLKLKAFLS
ncbi:hypothetical protein CEXT_119651 [Caerostris extrusa]|uniref:Uncharacterized protein n=1 Tax=Caerostris extrusa TaxID=172846 RepID=A0AAV4XNJ3_CAEEX|nr:hypothetical protein CEXT_119651 [Caerostris extrusa]